MGRICGAGRQHQEARRPAGLLSEVFAVLADMECSVVEARAWTHRGRLACVAFLRGEDADAGRVPRILAHADRRLH